MNFISTGRVGAPSLAALLLSTLAGASAQAGTITFTYGLPLQLSPAEIVQTGSLGLFDTALGTLTGATLTIEGGASFSFSGTNTAADSRTATLTSSALLQWSSSLAVLNPFLGVQVLSASSGSQAYAAGQTLNFGPLTDSDLEVDDLAGILASLQAAGGGAFGLTCSSSTGFGVVGGGGAIGSAWATDAGCGARIVYEYTARPSTGVPEPTSLALVGLALAGLGAAGRSRRA